MIRYLLIAAAGLLVSPAAAQTEHAVVGANPPAQYTVCAGDTLILKKPMGRDLLPDGSRASYASAWNDRARSNSAGNLFETVGATKLAPAGFIAGKGNVYRLLDAKPCASAFRFGANLSGAEAKGGDSLRPTREDWVGYVERYGFGLIRYPFIDVRMTPARIAELQGNVAVATSRGVPVILDNHTYRWDAPDKAVAFWTAFARNFPDDGSVMIDLVNEPKGFNDPVLTNDWDQWLRDSNLIIAGLRANGIRHPILLEYPGYSATFRFDKGNFPKKACESAACAIDRGGGLKDPLGLTYINAHRYPDFGSQGFRKDCVTETSGFAKFAAQLRQRGLKAYITETAFGSSYGVHSSCVAYGKDAIKAFKLNSDVLLGVTWWGGGRIWPESYAYKIDGPKAVRYSVPLNPYLIQILGK